MATPHTVAFHTLGCKLNFSESSALGRKFVDAGYGIVEFEEQADIYVINTCSVTDFADRKCRNIVRKAIKTSPHAKVIVTGCYAQLKPEEIVNIEGVDLVLGAKEKFNIIQYIDELSKSSEKGLVYAGEIQSVNSFHDAFSFGDRTRSFLKIQDGCDYKCSFCTIPQARGKSRCDSIENIVSNAEKIAALGVKEIVLTGVNIGDYLYKNENGGNDKFIDVIRALDKVDGIRRFRISSIEPNLCTNEVIDFVACSNKFVPHFHMPLQSGSDKLLKMMRRRYKKEDYANRVSYIKSLMPDCSIGVDVIVGFPGETDEDFEDTYRFLNELDVSYFHVFTYSERKNTLAADMADKVPMAIRKERNQKLRILSQKKKEAFYQKHLGEARPVLFEMSKKDGILSGFTNNYIKIEVPQEQYQVNTIHDVTLREVEDDCVLGI